MGLLFSVDARWADLARERDPGPAIRPMVRLIGVSGRDSLRQLGYPDRLYTGVRML